LDCASKWFTLVLVSVRQEPKESETREKKKA